MAFMDHAKMVMQLKKVQKQLANEIVEVSAGDDAVVVQVNGELKLKKVTIDPDRIDTEDIGELEQEFKDRLLSNSQIGIFTPIKRNV